MTSQSSSSSHGWVDIAAVMMRWLVGILFLYMGINKALHPVEFLKLLRQYEMLQIPLLLNSFAAMLPWFEIFCGLLLMLGIAVRGTVLMLLILLVAFTGIVLQRALALHTILAIPLCTVKFDCGCGAGEVFACNKLIENGILIVLSVMLLLGHGRIFCVRYSIPNRAS
jgi:uncharacterized membrane protein YphA (DoxX/SURF4 family)